MRPPPIRPLPTALGLVALIGLAALIRGHPTVAGPEGVLLQPVHASAPEMVDIRALRDGETLGEILDGSLGFGDRAELLLAFGEQASPRRMRVGTEVTLRYRARDRWLQGVDVMLNPDETLRLKRDDGGSWSSSLVRTPLWTDTIYVAGLIESSLWNAVWSNAALEDVPSGDRAALIDHLDKVFQWQVDFSRQIQPGDYFRFAFERRVRPDGSMSGGYMVAAELRNAGTAFHAIWFDPNDDGDGTYYDVEGRSVRRSFLRKPLEFRHISSRFSSARLHPILGTWRAHRGVDYAASAGTPVMATADGVIVTRGVSGGPGNAVEIRHSNGFTTRYGHLSRFAGGQSVGARVRQSDIVGFVGSTGLATGPHLHYEMRRAGQALDPLAVELPAGDPVPADDFTRWSTELVGRLALLEVLPGPDRVRGVSERGAPASPEDLAEGVPPGASDQGESVLGGSGP